MVGLPAVTRIIKGTIEHATEIRLRAVRPSRVRSVPPVGRPRFSESEPGLDRQRPGKRAFFGAAPWEGTGKVPNRVCDS